MLHIGLTGGIGSGKSSTAKIFHTLGIPVYYSDERAKWLMRNESELKEAIQKQFGSSIYNEGELDREKLADIVFDEPESLSSLNRIVHPRVRIDFLNWASQQNSFPYLIQEAAILIETGSWNKLDGIVLVTAPLELKIERVMKRDSVSRESVENRITSQSNDASRVPFSDFVVVNDGVQSLVKQVLDIHRRIID